MAPFVPSALRIGGLLLHLKTFALSVVILLGTQLLAHEGVKNPDVMARMHGMKTIAENMKVVGDMVKGTQPFDAAAAGAAMAGVAEAAGQTPALFTPQEDDPKSEALPAIWENFDDFTSKSQEMERIAAQLSTSIETFEDAQAAMVALGETCKACHSRYRE